MFPPLFMERFMNIEKLIQDLNKAEAAIKKANQAIDYLGGHGDEAAMLQVFHAMLMVNKWASEFTAKHGTSLDD